MVDELIETLRTALDKARIIRAHVHELETLDQKYVYVCILLDSDGEVMDPECPLVFGSYTDAIAWSRENCMSAYSDYCHCIRRCNRVVKTSVS